MMSRRFELHRDTDVSGISGAGAVVEGIEFTDGTVSLRWLSSFRSTAVYEGGIKDVVSIHGHNGATRVVWLDEEVDKAPNKIKKKPVEWATEEGVVIMDPDGWRRDGKSFDEPITEADYVSRKWISTIRTLPDDPSWSS